ncbi:hypothetical protein IMY05_006G0060700 [Salix suchowensis]|nr:hypothetical protein IMY05_006G0060700 [Salix suchowensis]
MHGEEIIPPEELDFDQEDFWTSDDSISNISPDYHQVERERCSNAAERLETENRELARAHATMESACFVVTALLPLAAFCMMKLYSDRLSPGCRKTDKARAFSCRRCPYLGSKTLIIRFINLRLKLYISNSLSIFLLDT